MWSRLRSERHDDSVVAFGPAAPSATARRQREPDFDSAIRQRSIRTPEPRPWCAAVRRRTRQLQHARWKNTRQSSVDQPSLAGSQYPHDLSLVPRQCVQDSGGWRRGRFQQQIVTVDFEVNTDSASRPQSLGCAHSRPLQPGVALLALDEITSFTGFGEIFPLFPLIPRFAVAGVLSRGMWGMRGMFLAGVQHWRDEAPAKSCPDTDTWIW